MACSMLFLFFSTLFTSNFLGECASKLPTVYSFGDIRLDADGLVLLYLGPDGTDISSMWGTLSSEGENGVYNTLCRQLGYSNGTPISIKSRHSVNSTVPVWLSNIDCNFEDHLPPNHILRCKYHKHEHNYKSDHPDIHVECYFREKNNDNMYAGQVVLLTKPYSNISVSFGMVAIGCYDQGDIWKYIYVDDLDKLSKTLTDTLCREIGFTNAVPNSARRLVDYTRMGYTFDDTTKFTAYINVSEINCATSYSCIRCCLMEKDMKNCLRNTQKRLSSAADPDPNALVIGCTLDNSSVKSVPEGHKGLCEIKTEHAICHEALPLVPALPTIGRTNSFDFSLEVLLPVVVISIVISFLITFLVTRYYIKRKYVRGDHRHLDPQGGPSPNPSVNSRDK